MNEKDLLELAKQDAPSKPIDEHDSEIEDFIVDLNITADPMGCVDMKDIHWFYVKWCDTKKIEPLHRKRFGIFFGKKFEKRKSFNRRTYRVNAEPFKMDNREYWMMVNYHREELKREKKAAGKRQASRAKKAVQQQS